MAISDIQRMKIILQEEKCGNYFSDDELEFYIEENEGDVNKAIYQCFMVKAQDTTLSFAGLNCADTSKYFRRMAQKYRPNNSGILRSE